MRHFVAFVFSCLLVAPIAHAFEGTYQIEKGVNQSGAPYTGTVVIKKNGDVYNVAWLLDGTGGQYQGVGIAQGEVLSVAWGGNGTVGAVSYLKQGTKLQGTWTTFGANKVGTEILSK